MKKTCYYYYCTRCGWVHELSQSKCPFCGSVAHKYDCHVYSLFDLTEKDINRIHSSILDIVENSPDFSRKAQKKRIKEQDKLKRYYDNKFQTNVNQSSQLTCPYCQSTNIKEISLGDKVVSLEMFDGGSPTIGKKWHCRKCGNYF